jgi:hypothetical protein
MHVHEDHISDSVIREISHSFADKSGFAKHSVAHNPLQVVQTIPFGLMKMSLIICARKLSTA